MNALSIARERNTLYERLFALSTQELEGLTVCKEILRPVCPDEPDTDIEVGYSKNALEPTTIEYQGRKTALSLTVYRLFRYINDLHRVEEQTEFEFAELSEALTGDELGKESDTIVRLIKEIRKGLKKIGAPFTLPCQRETLRIVPTDCE
jgi:hypothetical protein